jgi:flotillin
MGALLGNIGIVATIAVIVVVIIVLIYVRTRYKIAKADEALVITGGKKSMQIHKGGGAFVSPFRKHQVFSLGVMTVQSFNQETQTSTLVPIVVKWTAQVRPDTDSEGGLEKAIIGFSGMGNEDHISDSLTQTLDGEVRAVVATMTPEEVVTNKDDFAAKVKSGVSEQMENLGFTLVSLNIAEVSDNNGYYKNLAAKDREAQRQSAETLTAVADREVAVAQAAANQISESAVLDKDLAVAAKSRDVAVQKAAFKVEVDRAEKDAEYSGQLQTEDRRKELAARQGEVKVIEVQQAQAAAIARREVEITDADTARQRLQIESESIAKKVEIDAGAAANKLQIDTDAEAKAAKLKAEGVAEAVKAEAKGRADAQNLQTEADARKEREVGLVQAEVTRAQGTAAADATLAQGEAEAKALLLKAEALAAHGETNLKVTLAEIESKTRITIFTETGKAMASVGEKATIIDMGGTSGGGEGLLSRFMGDIPELMKRLDVKNEALNGAPVNSTIGSLIGSLLGRTAVPSASEEGKEPVVAPVETSVAVAVADAIPAEPSVVSGDAVAARMEAAASIVESASNIVNDVASVVPAGSGKSGRAHKGDQKHGEPSSNE